MMSSLSNKIHHLHELRRFHRARVRVLREEYTRVAHLPKLDALSDDCDFSDYRAHKMMRDYIQGRYATAREELRFIEAEYHDLVLNAKAPQIPVQM